MLTPESFDLDRTLTSKETNGDKMVRKPFCIQQLLTNKLYKGDGLKDNIRLFCP